MPYFNNIPQPADRISVSQGQILQNFQENGIIWVTDHVPFGAHEGKHNVVKFVSQAHGYANVPAATNIDLYNKIPEAPFAQTGLQELFLHVVAGIHVPITAKNPFNQAQNGARNWFYLPCGLMVKYGQSATIGAGTAHVDLHFITHPAIDEPDFTQAPFVFAMCGGAGAQANNAMITTHNAVALSFEVRVYPAAIMNFTWIAIGPV